MARVAGAERLMLPVLDILQSIPVLGFLPGLVLGLVHLFPRRNLGLEMASVLMIFTGQVWNMTFSFYSSLKSVPPDLVAVVRLARMSWWERFFQLELSFAATGLVWNSMMSMAGGWFFLTVSEAFVLGDHDFRLPGLGSYMSLAIERGDGQAQTLGVLAMLGMIVFVDQLVWRPVVAWAQKFTDEESAGESESWLWERILRSISRIALLSRPLTPSLSPSEGESVPEGRVRRWFTERVRRSRWWRAGSRLAGLAWRRCRWATTREEMGRVLAAPLRRWAGRFAVALVAAGVLFGLSKYVQLLSTVGARDWVRLLISTGTTLLRVMVAVGLASLWT